jgi:chemotaxis protein CheD
MSGLITKARRGSFFDPSLNKQVTKILPGDYFVTGEDMVLSTVLGSCVAACLWDPVFNVGGMNHFMLPDGQAEGDAPSARYGLFAMETLINDLVKLGAGRSNLRAKVFGGGRVLKQVTSINVGGRNAEFVMRFLKLENIPVLGHDLEGVWARKVNFFPLTARVLVKRLDPSGDETLIRSETEYSRTLKKKPVAGDIELF